MELGTGGSGLLKTLKCRVRAKVRPVWDCNSQLEHLRFHGRQRADILKQAQLHASLLAQDRSDHHRNISECRGQGRASTRTLLLRRAGLVPSLFSHGESRSHGSPHTTTRRHL
jgi:hypothetical protein